MKHPRGKSYDPEFKLRLAKEFAETDKTLEEIAQENGPIEATGMRLEVRRSRSSRSSNLFPLPLTSPQTKNLDAQRRMNVSFRGALVQLNRIDEKESEKDIQKLFLLFKNGFSCIE